MLSNGVAVLMLVPGSDIVVVLLFVPLVVALAAERSLASRLLRSGYRPLSTSA